MHGNSKEPQSSCESVDRFGEFELDAHARLLTRSGTLVNVAPKAFDALLCLVSRAEHLVTKSELTEVLWPSTFVSEANLTNTIVSLRKLVGYEAIRTVSKHGYRFTLVVKRESGVPPLTQDRFNRAKELTVQRSFDSTVEARRLYWICLAEDPGSAPAWAWHNSQMGFGDAAIAVFWQAAQKGFLCSSETLAVDPWLAAVRTHPEFDSLLQMEQDRRAEVLFVLERHPEVQRLLVRGTSCERKSNCVSR